MAFLDLNLHGLQLATSNLSDLLDLFYLAFFAVKIAASVVLFSKFHFLKDQENVVSDMNFKFILINLCVLHF